MPISETEKARIKDIQSQIIKLTEANIKLKRLEKELESIQIKCDHKYMRISDDRRFVVCDDCQCSVSILTLLILNS